MGDELTAPKRIWISEDIAQYASHEDDKFMGNVEYLRSNLIQQWQPIDTAPKDGSAFLGYFDEWQCVMIWDMGNKRFLTDDGRHFAYPTHWMPLPQPPT